MMTIKLVETLSNAPGVSGFEDDVLSAAKSYLGNSFHYKEDKIRNFFINNGPHNKKYPTIMLDAHSDEVGFMVQSINSNGTLKFIPLGGWNPQNVGGHPVIVKSVTDTWIKGVVAAKPIHFMSMDERKKPSSLSAMVIDIGACSKEEVIKRFKIRIGAPIVPDVIFSHDKKNDLIMGKAFDDRLGCAVLLKIMKKHIIKSLKINVAGVLSSQEELGLRGAKVSVRTINPDAAIVLEGTPADDTFNSSDFIQAGLRKGPQIRHMDQSVLCNPRFVRFAIKVAEKKKIKFQEAVRSSGGNNSGVITLNNQSVPTITLGVPVRYIHSHNCIATMEDFNNTVKWCSEILKALNQNVINEF